VRQLSSTSFGEACYDKWATPLRKQATCTYATILLHHNSPFLLHVLIPTQTTVRQFSFLSINVFSINNGFNRLRRRPPRPLPRRLAPCSSNQTLRNRFSPTFVSTSRRTSGVFDHLPVCMCYQPCTPRDRPLNPCIGEAVKSGTDRTPAPSASRRRWRALGRLVAAVRRCGRPRAVAQWQRGRGRRSVCPMSATAPQLANRSSLPCLLLQGGARRSGLGACGHRAGLHRPPTDAFAQRATKDADADRLPAVTRKTCGGQQGRRSPTRAGRHAVGVPTTGSDALERAATGGSLLLRRARRHRRPETAGRRSGRVQPLTQPRERGRCRSVGNGDYNSGGGGGSGGSGGRRYPHLSLLIQFQPAHPPARRLSPSRTRALTTLSPPPSRRVA